MYKRQIALYNGHETRPVYRRYKVPQSKGSQVIADLKKSVPPLVHDDEELPLASEDVVTMAATRASMIENRDFDRARALEAIILEQIDAELNDYETNDNVPLNIEGHTFEDFCAI